MREITTSWIEKGRKEGKLEGQLEILRRMITKKFGPLSADTSRQIDALASEELDLLAEHLLDFQDVSDLIHWLENR